MGQRFAALTLFVLAACGDGLTETCDNTIDDDEDGHVDCADQDCAASCTESCGNGDDDDGDGLTDCFDPDCVEGCLEVCDNGKDDDDDGLADCGDPDCASGCAEVCVDAADNDGDLLIDCADPDCLGTCDKDGDGFFDAGVNGEDCDDDDADVHPGAVEVYYDGLDNDCDPATIDDDQDGDGSVEGADCDDNDALSFPGAPEVCGDGKVNTCGGAAPSAEACYGTRSLASAEHTFLGQAFDDAAGAAVSWLGDTNGDGSGEVAIGAYKEGALDAGALYVVFGPFPQTHALGDGTDTKFVGVRDADWAGYSISGGHDVTQDGATDLVVGAPYHDGGLSNTGNAYIHTGATPLGTRFVDIGVAELFPGSEYSNAGSAVAATKDMTGDGLPDLLVGASNYETEDRDSGGVFVVPGPMGGERDLLTYATSTWVGGTAYDQAGYALAAADVDADGLDDAIIGAPFADFGGLDAGGAYLSAGPPILGTTTVTDATAFWSADHAGDNGGAAVAAAGDLNGDGTDDWAAGASVSSPCATRGGSVSLLFGPSLDLVQADVTLCGSTEEGRAGASVRAAGDVDGDGQDDLAVGANESTLGGEFAGAVFVLFGPITGPTDLESAADITVLGDPFSFTGSALDGAFDANGDDKADLLVGSVLANGQAGGSGSATLFTFGY